MAIGSQEGENKDWSANLAMSLVRGMQSAVTGVNAEGEALGVISDNIANADTTGFKQEDAVFENVLGRSMLEEGAAGGGVRMDHVTQPFTQGALVRTGVPTDLALSGDGFFSLAGTLGGVDGAFYTRSGAFHIDAGGFLVSPEGLALQGYNARPSGGFAAAPSNVRLPTSALPAQPTATMTLSANLDAESIAPTVPWDPQSPATTSNFATSVTVYDSLGQRHDIQVAFRANGPGRFNWFALASGADVAGGTSGQNVPIGQGTLAFDTSGALQTSAVITPVRADFAGAAPGQNIDISFGSSTGAGGTGLDGVTQFSAPFNISSLSQDGFASGSVAGFTVDAGGVLRGIFSNGRNLPIAQIAIAKFRSNDGLGRAGQNAWISTKESGPPSLGPSGSGGRGALTQGTLEQSNVDISTQFVGLIAHQRGFEANSKVITTADDMLASLISIKR
jgi:flagellar hook protein FlgE